MNALILLLAAFGPTYEAEVLSVYDGDSVTVVLTVPVEYEAVTVEWVDRLPVTVTVTGYPEEKLRIDAVDTPELRGRCPEEKQRARAARDWLRDRVEHADLIAVKTDGREKYGRLLGDLIIDGESVRDGLIAAGHGRPYDGGKRKSWCD